MGFLDKFEDLDQGLRRRSDRREARFVRQNRRGIFWWFVLPMLPMLIVVTVALILAVGIERKDRQVAARLAADGAVAEGIVTDVDVRIKGDLIFSDRVRVTFFSDDGRWWTTSVASRIRVEEGPVAVRYLRSDPPSHGCRPMSSLERDVRPPCSASAPSSSSSMGWCWSCSIGASWPMGRGPDPHLPQIGGGEGDREQCEGPWPTVTDGCADE